MAYGSFVLMRDLNFTINHGDIFIIMGGSGSGKSTLLRHLIGLNEPARGETFYGDENFTKADPAKRQEILRRVGVLFQSGALWSSMTLAENVGLPLEEYTDFKSGTNPRDRIAKARPCRIEGFRRLLSVRDQRRHAEARRAGSCHGARS